MLKTNLHFKSKEINMPYGLYLQYLYNMIDVNLYIYTIWKKRHGCKRNMIDRGTLLRDTRFLQFSL